MRKTLTAAAALAVLAVAGVLAALTFAPVANAYTVGDLEGLGYRVQHTIDQSPPAGVCPETYLVAGYGSSILLRTCDLAFSQKLDEFVRATCPCAQTTAAPTTTAATTTTETAPPPPPVTTTVTVTTPPPVEVIDDLTARIVALERQIAALTTRVDRLDLAGDASWLAYQQSIEKGDPPDVAAGLARATWLNAVYALGAFA